MFIYSEVTNTNASLFHSCHTFMTSVFPFFIKCSRYLVYGLCVCCRWCLSFLLLSAFLWNILPEVPWSHSCVSIINTYALCWISSLKLQTVFFCSALFSFCHEAQRSKVKCAEFGRKSLWTQLLCGQLSRNKAKQVRGTNEHASLWESGRQYY